ncbi:MAG: UDP-3-O-(3-hydroxymyristoyl)glucosamine N-acyltransferase, partial [Gammaproteobacteria bacterium]|nr:UDP-3-O-(3-hydroxymyristoyl)glucosamine N-acyltransferase [Gammaproteobacteria bacterium]
DGVVINAASLVTQSVEHPGRYGSGMPLQPEQAWRRSFVTLGKLDQLLRRIRRLERLKNVE